jgi:hypothetical protein
VRAAPGELNRITVRRSPRGVVIEDLGAPLTGACRPASSGGRFCPGQYDGLEVQLGDGDDRIDLRDLGGSVDGGPGDDDVVVAGAPFLLTGGAGADRLDARLAPGSGISYLGHTDGVTVSFNSLPDDGAPDEGDNVLGAFTSIEGGSGDDLLQAGPNATSLVGGAGDDTLVGSPEGESILGQDGNDDLIAGDGNDSLDGGAGTDRLSGGPGRDEASYAAELLPLRLSIGDGPGDGAEGEGDDILADVENLIGGRGADVLIGDADANRLVGLGGGDTLLGGGGSDTLEGSDDGDRLDPGPGRDRVHTGASDLPLLDDGEADRTDCNSTAPVIEADSLDTFRRCAPRVLLRRVSGPDAGGVVRVSVRCDPRSAVRCAGSLQLRVLGVVRSRSVRFGPIPPRRREALTLRMRGRPLAHNTCVRWRAVSTRRDAPSSTVSSGFVRCRL